MHIITNMKPYLRAKKYTISDQLWWPCYFFSVHLTPNPPPPMQRALSDFYGSPPFFALFQAPCSQEQLWPLVGRVQWAQGETLRLCEPQNPTWSPPQTTQTKKSNSKPNIYTEKKLAEYEFQWIISVLSGNSISYMYFLSSFNDTMIVRWR